MVATALFAKSSFAIACWISGCLQGHPVRHPRTADGMNRPGRGRAAAIDP